MPTGELHKAKMSFRVPSNRYTVGINLKCHPDVDYVPEHIFSLSEILKASMKDLVTHNPSEFT